MWDVRIDIERNRLYIKLSADGGQQLAEQVYAITSAARKLNNGFTCLTEIPAVDEVTKEQDTYIRLVQECLAHMGMSTVVRVGSSEMNQEFDKRALESGGYSASCFESVEAGDAFLDTEIESIWEVKSDNLKNTLYLKLCDLPQVSISEIVHAISFEMKNLTPGFSCVTHFAEEWEITDDQSKYIKLVQEFLALMGVGQVVRVGSKDMHDIFENISKQAGGYCAAEAETIDDAYKLIDEIFLRR